MQVSVVKLKALHQWRQFAGVMDLRHDYTQFQESNENCEHRRVTSPAESRLSPPHPLFTLWGSSTQWVFMRWLLCCKHWPRCQGYKEGQDYPLQYSWASLVAQMVKNLSAMRETWVGKIPWRRTWQPTLVFLPGESPWREGSGGLQSIGLQRVGHDWAAKHSTVVGAEKDAQPGEVGREGGSSPERGVLVLCGCCNKYPQAG